MIPSQLLVVTDRRGSERPLVDTVRTVLDGGARWIWFRDKDLEPRVRRELARELLAVVRECDGRLSLGGDVEIAAAIGADGVHLGRAATASDVACARQRLSEDSLIGISAHDLDDVRRAASAGADYVTLSPIFPTDSKPGYGPVLGLTALRKAAKLGVPVIALGGIGAGEVRACLDAGANGVAVMGGLMRAADPVEETRHLLKAMRRSP